MNKSKIAIITVAIVVLGTGLTWLSSNIHEIPGLKNLATPVVEAMIVILGLMAAGVTGWIVSRKFTTGSAPAKTTGDGEPAEITDLDELLTEAEARLREAQLEKAPVWPSCRPCCCSAKPAAPKPPRW